MAPPCDNLIYLFQVIMDLRHDINKIRWIFKGWDTCKCIVSTSILFFPKKNRAQGAQEQNRARASPTGIACLIWKVSSEPILRHPSIIVCPEHL
jgi:hypothetical protein